MRKKIFSVALVGAIVFSAVPAFAVASESGTDENVSVVSEQQLDRMTDNLTSKDKTLVKAEKEAMYSTSEDKPDCDITTKQEFQKAVDKLDETSNTYADDLAEIIDNTDPDVYSEKLEDDAKELASSLPKINEMEPDQVLKAENDNGDVHTMEVYKLQSGAEILFEGIDEEEPIEVGSELMQPGSIKYATWVVDKNIFKPIDKRRFTAIYNLKSGGKIKGRISVTNHYTVNAKSITMRSPAIWETNYESPLKVSTHKDAYKSKRTKLTKAGQQFYAGAQFYVTISKKITTSSTTTAGADLGISISQSAGTSITWEKNVKSLHKIYAIVTLNKFAKGGAYMKHSGKVAFAY